MGKHQVDSKRPLAGVVLAALLAGLGAALGSGDVPVNSHSGELVVSAYRSASCGCCKGWLDHLKAEGFSVRDHVVEDLPAIKRTHRVPAELASCHTATVAGYVIEGHVPATAIRTLLQQRPAVAGLAVPGMPLGSPGMESPLRSESYTVFSFMDNGAARPFQQIGA